jgi:hypothetical protein
LLRGRKAAGEKRELINERRPFVFVLYFLLLSGSCHRPIEGGSVSSPRQPVHPSETRGKKGKEEA